MPTAKTEAHAFRTGAAPRNNPFQMRQVHQLIGLIALEMKDYDKAVTEFQQANQQNPYDLVSLVPGLSRQR